MHNNHGLHGYLRPNKGEQKMKKPKFKVGDRVEITEVRYPYIGKTGTIKEVDKDNEMYVVKYSTQDWFHFSYLRKVK